MVSLVNASFSFVAGYQCRQWESTDISFVLALGDNYESSVAFLMIASQYVFSAIALNFGFTYRKHWLKNYPAVLLVTGFMFIHYWITLVPGHLSCWLRINCLNEDNQSISIYNMGPVAIQNAFNSTLMPVEFRRFLAILMTVNLLAVVFWEYVIVGQKYGKRIWLGTVGSCCEEKELCNAEKLSLIGTAETTKSHELKCDAP